MIQLNDKLLMFKTLLLLLIILFTPFTFSQEVSEAFNEIELNRISKNYELSSYLYQLALEKSQIAEQPLSDSFWINELKNSSKKIMEISYAKNLEDKVKLSRFSNLIKWDKWWDQAKSIIPKIKSMSRLNGKGVAFTFIALSPADIYMPIIVSLLGHPELAPFVVALPLNTMGVGGQLLIQNIYQQQETIKAFGGKENYQAFIQAKKESRKLLKMQSAKDYIHALNFDGNEIEAITIQNENILTKTLKFFGRNQNGTNYSKVKDFIMAKGLDRSDEYLKSLLHDDHFPKNQRAGMLIEYLLNSDDDLLVKETRAQFFESFVKIPNSKDLDQVYKVASEMKQVKSFEELKALFYQLPDNLNAKIFIQVFKQDVLPHLASEMEQINYKDFRRLIKKVTPLYGEILKNPSDQYLDDELKALFIRYIDFASSAKHVCNDQLSPL
jgi:hypothetical protein